MRSLIALTVLMSTLAGSATAQISPYGYPYSGMTVGEQHRYEMDRLQSRSDQQENFARQQRLEARQTVRELQARRQLQPYQPAPYGPLRTVEQERALREAATTRRETTQAGVAQIDAWLDRSPQ